MSDVRIETKTEDKRNEYSQQGEDTLLERVFSTLKIKQGWCVEFGAWDGMHLSNTFNLIKNHGWQAVMIEGDRVKAAELVRNMEKFPGVTCVNRFVALSGANSLDTILRETRIPRDFDLLSIDIDGADYHVWASVEEFRPKAVIIEFNVSIPDDISFIQAHDMRVHQGCSLRALIDLGRNKGYRLVANTDCNAIFVRDEYFALFSPSGEDIPIERDRSYQTILIQGYDGTLHIAGCRTLIWHNIEIREGALQVLPKLLRFFPDAPQNVPIWKRILLSLWSRLLSWRFRS